MHIIYRLGSATAADVREEMEDPPSYSAVRALLATLVRKGALAHEADGPRYRYRPTEPVPQAASAALKRVVKAFFAGSASRAALELLEMDQTLSEAELQELEQRIQAAELDR